MIVAENKKTGMVVDFTPEQWRNMEKTSHARYWRILSADLVPRQPEVFQVEEIIPHVEEEVEFSFIDYRQKLTELGVKFDGRIKDQEKLKEIYEANVEK